MTVLVVGATGSIGRHVVEVAVTRGHAVRALVRDAKRARRLLPEVELAVGNPNPTRSGPQSMASRRSCSATGRMGAGRPGAEQIDYGGVRNVLAALRGRQARIALMPAIGVTTRDGTTALTSDAARGKTFELVAEQGPAPADLEPSSRSSIRIHEAGSTRSVTSRTCHSAESPRGCGTISGGTHE